METPLPTAAKTKSLNVEESRAKRLERQQARLRDRGGIFRPKNRNNNLFDILIQATHRKSPAKGRSRSRSVSPQKKVSTTPNNVKKPSTSRPSASKRKSVPEVPDDDTGTQVRAKNAKGKQKQVSEVEETEDKPTKPKPRSKKAAPQRRKNTAPRRKARAATIDNAPEENVALTKAPKARPKGRRKKQGTTTRNKPIAKGSADATTEINAPEKSKQHKPVAPVASHNEDGGNRPIKIGKPAKKAKADTEQPVSLPDDPPPPPPATKPRPRKRKAEPEIFDAEELPPTKRRAPSKSQPATLKDQSLKSGAHTSAQPASTSQALADAINDASSSRSQAEDDKSLDPKRPGKKLKTTTSEEPSHSHSEQRREDSEPRAVPKAKRKRPPVTTEMDEASEVVETATKKPKTTSTKPKKDVLQAKAIDVPETKGCSSKTKSVSEPMKGDDGNRPVKTVSRKRKENATSAKPAKAASTSKDKSRTKGGPCIPLHAKKKLEARHDHIPSDDEADPIDFLS
ncbi:hypothetical protein D9756_008073 [Leucocoprinus leucothites]|uniref:Uncharacterized protein n=1 Tax=Leucocoprinus leucothites TaxID=201217 RepID=A0A8H5FYA7_9AGAR|nr:hypothetical protein D9756_008073 [Leucoagaricus leucothites]